MDLKKLTASNYTTLFNAEDLQELVAVMENLEHGLSGWMLLWPVGRREPIVLKARDQLKLAKSTVKTVRQFSYPELDVPVAKTASWAKSFLAAVRNEAPFTSETDLLLPIRVAGTLVAVAGFANAKVKGATVNFILERVAQAVQRLHQVDSLRQDIEAQKFIMTHWASDLVMVTHSGKVVGGTQGGLAILREISSKISNGEKRAGDLPSGLKRAVEANEDCALVGYKISLQQPALFNYITTVEGLIRISFTKKLESRQNTLAAANLTPAQQRVHSYLMQGDRNKEIADKLQISEHTVRHHVSAVLQKFQCSDRLLLVARSSSAVAMVRLEAPHLGTGKTLPPAKQLNVTTGALI